MCYTNNFLFVKHSSQFIIIMLIYVDDILITGNDPNNIHRLLTILNRSFDMRHLKDLKHFLGIDFICTNEGLLLS